MWWHVPCLMPVFIRIVSSCTDSRRSASAMYSYPILHQHIQELVFTNERLRVNRVLRSTLYLRNQRMFSIEEVFSYILEIWLDQVPWLLNVKPKCLCVSCCIIGLLSNKRDGWWLLCLCVNLTATDLFGLKRIFNYSAQVIIDVRLSLSISARVSHDHCSLSHTELCHQQRV